jgi:GNAT superfamily N-acetyltransferase
VSSPQAIRYEEGGAIPVARYQELRAAVGWGPAPGGERALASALGRTWNVVARDGGDIVGIGRLLDDGAVYATIWDMIVAPERQRAGIGTAILERLMGRASARTIVALVATAGGRPLYERHGFASESRGSVGMLLRPPGAHGT